MANALKRIVTTLLAQLWQSLTWDRGKEQPDHVRFTIEFGVSLFFADPQTPLQWRVSFSYSVAPEKSTFSPKPNKPKHPVDAARALHRQTSLFLLPPIAPLQPNHCAPAGVKKASAKRAHPL